MTFGPEFPACVVYNPPHREAICIEPYTAVPDAFALESRGIAAGLRVLKPGESFKGQIDIAVVPVA
jgi:aldose 1-epimerase